MKSRLLKIAEIIFDPEIYPRLNVNPTLVELYADAMEKGEKFPPISVGNIKTVKGIQLIDGKHRLEATKKRGEKYIAATIKGYENKRDAFIDAVKLNVKHGKPLSWIDRENASERLAEFGVKRELISGIVRLPVQRIQRVKAFSKELIERQVPVPAPSSADNVDETPGQATPELDPDPPTTPEHESPKDEPKKAELIELRSPDEVVERLKHWWELHDELAKEGAVESGNLDEVRGRIYELQWMMGREALV